MINVDQRLPSFCITASDGTVIDPTKMLGSTWILYFYPRDDTPGCTLEARDFSRLYERFREAGVTVVGISRDTDGSHQRFVEKYGLTFPLIADPEEKLCQLFGVMREKNMYGKKVRVIERTTMLINREGIIKRIWRPVKKVEGHVEAVLSVVQANAAEQT